MPHSGHSPRGPGPPPPGSTQSKGYFQFLGLALSELLIEKGILTSGALRALMESLDSVNVAAHGAKVVAKAWIDPEFHDELMRNAGDAVKAIGLEPGCPELIALPNGPHLHNLVVSSLCQCYPRALLGRPPSWYTSNAYRSRAVREPRKVLAEFGTHVPDDTEVRVHDCTAELRYIVVPQRPPGTEGWSEEELARLVTAQSMVGVMPALSPEKLAAEKSQKS